MLTDFGPKIWESKINPYFKRNKFIFYILTAFLVFVPILFFPINLIADMLWGSFFYSLIYFLCLPFIILFSILGLTFSRKYLKIYERGIKIKINPLNPFSKKKKIMYNQIKTIELGTTEPIIYNNKISKFLLYEPDSISTIKKTGDYSVISIITNDGKIFTTRNSFISELEIARNIISRQISKKIDVEPKIIIKKPLKKVKVVKPAKKLKFDKKPILKVDKEEDAEEKGDFCKFCGAKLPGAKIFCIKCGKKMIDEHEINFCKYCGREVSGSGEFCVKCGKEIS